MKLHQILLLHIATSILALFPSPIYAQKMMYQDSIEIVVHRGANHIAPENTIPSALAALEHGAGWIEVDVRKVKTIYFIICTMKLWTVLPTVKVPFKICYPKILKN